MFGVRVGWGGLKRKKKTFLDDMMTFSGAHQKQPGLGDRERGVQATDRVLLLLALLPKKICMCVCWVGCGGVFVLFIYYLFIFPTDTGSVKINNASVPPEVLNSVVRKEERKNTTPLPK